MEPLIRAQTDTRNNIERSQVNYKKSPKDRRSATHIKTRLDNLERDWALYCNTHRQILSKADANVLDALPYMQEDKYGAVEELYIDFKSDLKEDLANKQSSVAAAPSTSGTGKPRDGTNNIKLPKISIPNFSGKYDEWITFRDLFESLIRKNKSLDNVQKLHYLKGYLTGEAEQLLRHIPITQDNFEVCWKQLESRYDNKKYLANCVLKRFFGQKNLQTESASAIKELLDTTNECLHALENLGVDIKSWDIIVIYIVSSKLDSETRKLWEAKTHDLSTSGLPKLVNFKEFLEQRFRSLEFLDTKSMTEPKQYPFQNTTARALHATENSVTCLYCKETHKITNCKSFAKEDVETRREFVQTNRLCFNCLGANHPVFSCRLATRCRVCQRKHHSLLHSEAPQGFPEVEQGDTALNSSTSAPGDSVNVVSCFTNVQSQVLLATALVHVESPAGTHVLRSLIDPGSQASFITEAAVQLLRLKKMPSKCLVSGVGSDKKPSCASNYVVVLKLQSLHDSSVEIKVKAHVLRNITSFIPDHQVKLGLWSELSQVKLADPAFATPNKIDVLLGAEVYGQIIVDGIIRGPPGTPLAQNTKLGWIISGQVSNECSDNTLCHTISVVSNHAQISENDPLKKFCELESDHSQIGTNKVLIVEKQNCEQFTKETKVTPIKQIFTPRSELCGVVLITNLLMVVAEGLGFLQKENIQAWTDLLVVLAWLWGHSSKFMANRVSEIFMLLVGSQWSHVKSKDNSADCASRVVKPSDLIQFELWKHGPTWLKDRDIEYSSQGMPGPDLDIKTKGVKSCVTACQEKDEVGSRVSSFRLLKRVGAWCKRFISRCRNKAKSFYTWLTTAELNDEVEYCDKTRQTFHISEGVVDLSMNQTISKKSRKADHFIDVKGLLRGGGRLNHAESNERFKHPVVSSRKSRIVDLSIADAHEQTLHGGPQL